MLLSDFDPNYKTHEEYVKQIVRYIHWLHLRRIVVFEAHFHITTNLRFVHVSKHMDEFRLECEKKWIQKRW